MATKIQIKRTNTGSHPSALYQGELNYIYDTSNTQDGPGERGKKLYIGDPTSHTNTPIAIGGQYYTNLLDHVPGTLTASAALMVDSDSKIDVLNVDNITLNLNTISTTNTNGDLNITPNGEGKTVVKNLYIGDNGTSLEEYIEDITGGQVTAGTAMTVTYDDAAGTLSVGVTDGAIGTTQLTDSGVTTAKIADLNVTTGKLANSAVTTDKLNDGAVTTAKITDANVTTAKLANSAVETAKLADGAVTTVKITDGDVTNAKLANSSITIGTDPIALGTTQTDLNGLTSVDVDNITLDGSTISTTNTDGDLTIAPNGEGTIKVPAGYEGRTSFSADSLVNKKYVDQVASGLDVKESVRVATTANLTATYNNGTAGSGATLTASSNGLATFDGVDLSVGDRVLVKDQTNAEENGIYVVTNIGGASAVWVLTRAGDADAAAEITGGAFTFVEEGTANADNGYVATHDGTPVLGTNDITFEQFSGAGQIDAGAALSKDGNTINVNVDDSTVEVVADALQLKDGGITNSKISTNAAIAQSKLNLNAATARSSATGISIGDLGIASFDSNQFTLTNGWATVHTIDGGTYS
jgi:hypothetical protein